MLLRCLLGSSWGLLRRLGRLLEALGSLLGASWGILAASWRPLGFSWGSLGGLLGLLASSWGLLRVSWELPGGLLRQLGWPISGKVALAAAGARFWELPGRLLGGKVALARAGAGFSGGRRGCAQVQGARREGAAGPCRDPPLPKLIAKAISDTIMSLLAN